MVLKPCCTVVGDVIALYSVDGDECCLDNSKIDVEVEIVLETMNGKVCQRTLMCLDQVVQL
jgi:hypothetical protein